jgi:NADH-quinone oxidoreductase subunit N
MDLMLFAPELILLLGSLIAFFLTISQSGGRSARALALAVTFAAMAACAASFCMSGTLFFDAYRIDLFSQLFKLVILAGMAAVLLLGSELKDIEAEIRPEYYLFLLLSVLGLVMLVSSVELLAIFIALELSSYSLYVLVPMRSDSGGLRMQMESAIKYILFGAVATGVMLFGMSYMFGLTGTTYLNELLPRLQQIIDTPAAIMAIAMVLGGFLFKLAAFPFHSWVPDVYQGASNETTAFIASVPKVAAVALLIRITTLAAPAGQEIATLLTILAILSMFYGNLIALVQTDIKRMLAFSGIAHAGYVLLGLVTLKDSGYAAAIYYITGYLFMNLAAFLVICKLSREGENLVTDDLGGLHKRSPLLAVTMAVSMFSMAGIPPFAGFMGKFSLMTEAYKAGHLALVIVAAINTAIGIYYYLSVVRVTYSPSVKEKQNLSIGLTTKLLSFSFILIIVLLGVIPEKFILLATEAVRAII